jgi:uncharacterized protein (DUF3820 family)
MDYENEFNQHYINFLQMSLTFGKFKGKRLNEVPISYLLWLAGFDNNLKTLAETVMMNKDFDSCASWLCAANVETLEECENMLKRSFDDKVVPICIVGQDRAWWTVYTYNRRWVYLAREEFQSRGICRICLGKLVPIGLSRANGKEHPDWHGRTTHKGCWRNQKIAEQF